MNKAYLGTSHQTQNSISQGINRELKIEDSKINKDFKQIDEYLKTVSKKFMKELVSLEKLDKEYNDIMTHEEGKDKSKQE